MIELSYFNSDLSCLTKESMTFHMIFEVEHVDISAKNHLTKTIGMKIELIFDKFLKMLKIENINLDSFEHRILLDRFHDIFSVLHHIFSIVDRLELILIRTTYIAFLVNILLAKNFPKTNRQNSFHHSFSFPLHTRVNFPATSSAVVI